MANKDFEFYEYLDAHKKELEAEEKRKVQDGIEIPKELRDDPFASKEERKATSELRASYVTAKKQELERRQRQAKKAEKARTKAISLLLAGTMMAGFGLVSMVDYLKPKVAAFHDYESNRTIVAGYYDNFVTGEGYLETLGLAVEPKGFLDDTPDVFDVNNEDNITINKYGEKEGPLVDFYDHFDSYLEEHSDKGYYERMLEMYKAAEVVPFLNKGIECIYTQEELENIVKTNNQEVGGPRF